MQFGYKFKSRGPLQGKTHVSMLSHEDVQIRRKTLEKESMMSRKEVEVSASEKHKIELKAVEPSGAISNNDDDDDDNYDDVNDDASSYSDYDSSQSASSASDNDVDSHDDVTPSESLLQ